MAGETIITVIGNLTDDPELRYTAGGVAVATFTAGLDPASVRPAGPRVARR